MTGPRPQGEIRASSCPAGSSLMSSHSFQHSPSHHHLPSTLPASVMGRQVSVFRAGKELQNPPTQGFRCSAPLPFGTR